MIHQSFQQLLQRADALNEADYTAESWAAMKLEYEEAVDELAVAEYQADVDEATEHLTAKQSMH